MIQRKREIAMYGFSKSELAALNEAAQERELNDEEATAFEFILDPEYTQDLVDKRDMEELEFLHTRWKRMYFFPHEDLQIGRTAE